MVHVNVTAATRRPTTLHTLAAITLYYKGSEDSPGLTGIKGWFVFSSGHKRFVSTTFLQ